MHSWIKVFEDQNQIRAEIVKGVLEENGIAAVLMNKKRNCISGLGYLRSTCFPRGCHSCHATDSE
ncbi:DUF2007 domain-containing protein [Algoriphagus boritolerans]|uniref:putative signal transducing protein n=1 Tax=Algoriphagus boritolerans TaxID=308111 RepID=UPI002FCE140B